MILKPISLALADVLSKDVIDNVENLTGIRSLERGLQATEDIGE